MAWVRMRNPDSGLTAEVTQEAFDLVWAPKGWVLDANVDEPRRVRTENTDDVQNSTVGAPLLIPNTSIVKTKRAGKALRVKYGGRLYNLSVNVAAKLQAYYTLQPAGVETWLDEAMHTSSTATAAGTVHRDRLLEGWLPPGQYLFTWKIATPAAGTAHIWGSATFPSWFEVAEEID